MGLAHPPLSRRSRQSAARTRPAPHPLAALPSPPPASRAPQGRQRSRRLRNVFALQDPDSGEHAIVGARTAVGKAAEVLYTFARRAASRRRRSNLVLLNTHRVLVGI